MEQPPSCSSDPPISGRENTEVTEGVVFWGTSCDGTAAAERPSKGWGGGAANSWLLGECEDVREKGWSEN